LVAVGEPLTGSAADKATIIISEDGGTSWVAAAADPFAVAEAASAVICIPLDLTSSRIIVARGTADAGNPAEIAYSDDGGATWHLVNVGAVNGQYVLASGALFSLDPYHTWLATSDGYIYFSPDAGLTWTAQTAGTLTAEDLRGVMFEETGGVGYAVGDNNAILYTQDEGDDWAVLTGPAGKATDEIYALFVVDKLHVWIGYNDGELYYTANAGTTWYERVWSGLSNTGQIADITFTSELEGWLIHNTAGPVGSLWRTIDGGYTWQQVAAMPTNAGLNALLGCGTNHIQVVGNVEAATPVILSVSETV
jgi:photosystem II stability/assembly factor-like uncharacterized protein